MWAAFLPFIEGRFRGGTGHSLTLVSPSTGEPIARVVCAGPEEIDRAVEAAAAASSLWRRTPFAERAVLLARLADRILEHSGGLARLISLEQGKPVTEALQLEILPSLDHLRFLARHGESFYRTEGIEPREPLFSHKQAHYLYDPLGVVALVTPFTLPLALPLAQVGAALVMGNAVVLKPSGLTPLSALRIGELCAEAGFPAGLVNVVPASREDTLRLVAHPKVDKVFVTGSLETGQYVMATAGCAPRPVVLSMGGKHPSVVAADADVERAARGIVWGALANAGQNCGSVERVYVEEAIAARFLECVLEATDALTMGDPLDDSTDLGPLISENRRQIVHAHVTDAVSSGARLLRGGRIPQGPGFYYPATVLLGPPPESRVLREETLGPVIPIVVVDSVERALMLANETEYALTASGWTTSAVTAERLMAGLQAGVVTVNDVLYSFGEPASTWSGYKKSGIGHTHGIAGLREMCRQRFVSFDPLPAEAPVFAFPYDGAAVGIVEDLIEALHSTRRGTRLRALAGLVGEKRFRARVPIASFLASFKRRGR